MKSLAHHYLYFFGIPYFLLVSCTGIKQNEKLELGNGLYTKTFYYQTDKPGPIQVEYKKGGQIINDAKTAYFEFVIGDLLTTSLDDCWMFDSHTARNMGNGGVEHHLIFNGSKGQVDGLKVKIIQQVFPGSSLIREKLELEALDSQSFTLNKLENKLHFHFPQYGFFSKDKNPTATEIKIATWELKPITFKMNNPDRNQNHMYYPEILQHVIKDELHAKGPINILNINDLSWITTYEHASQDNLNGLLDNEKVKNDGKIVDAMQGTKGIFNFPINDDDFRFIEIYQRKENQKLTISNAMARGGYLEGEIIDKDHGFSTVWNATAFQEGADLETSKTLIRNYLFNEICEKPASRKPEFYYNTWGMQRANRNKSLRRILTYERIFEEIDRAAQLGVDIFVLDDGWEQAQGDWTPNKERLQQGLEPIKKKLDSYGIKMGVWLSPMGIDSTTERYKQHPEWVIKDSEGNPILAQWGHPAFDFVGGFFDVFIEDCKRLIDVGVLFFKWDAINTFYSSLPNLDHGSNAYSEEERRARYEYLLPVYVTRAMEILTEYEPELIIEMDVTEARRVMIGLAPLSQGKLFFMNNGASWYNDYTEFRTNSMRTIPNEYNGIIPLELFTYANYPHNLAGKLNYNINTSLIAGHGFWGDLSLTTEVERKIVGEKVAKSKQVLPYLTDIKTDIIGKVGDSPEIYTQINHEAGAGQIIAFCQEEFNYSHKVNLETDNYLAILNHPYQVKDDQLTLNFNFPNHPSSLETFLIPGGNEISIISSTSTIMAVKNDTDFLEYKVIDPGTQEIIWAKDIGKPVISETSNLEYQIEEMDDQYKIMIEVYDADKPVRIEKT